MAVTFSNRIRRGGPTPTADIRLFDVHEQNLALAVELSIAMREVFSGACFVGGPQVESFEREFAEFCACRSCVAVASGTDALYVALKALGIGPGDEVITTAYSFVATAQAITRTGAAVKFVDIEPATFNIDPARIPEQITPRTRAIVPVHLFGHPADMATIERLARKNGLKIVEDAAQAHGALDHRRAVGSLSDAASFSFYPTKNIGACGDGGAVVTQDVHVAECIRSLSNHAWIGNDDYQADGINSRLDAIQAAILRIKLRRLADWNERRRAIARFYSAALSGLGLGLPMERSDAFAVYHVYAIRLNALLRDDLRSYLARSGIESRIYYPRPLPFLTAYSCFGSKKHSYPVATRASRELLALPCNPSLTDSMVERVTDCIREFIKGHGRNQQPIH